MASLQPAGDETGVIDVPLIEPRLTLFNLTVRGVRMEQLNGWPVVVIASPYAVFTTSPPMPDELGVADSNFPAMQEGATTHSYVWNSLYTRNKPRFPAGSTIAKLVCGENKGGISFLDLVDIVETGLGRIEMKFYANEPDTASFSQQHLGRLLRFLA